jgi:demethylmenaquinone methyltransferase/2-methoxy-6-polyprenyl-1,4-benzoquinol methylase
LLPAPADLARRYDAAANRWHAHMRYLGYPRAYADLFAHLRAEGWLSRLDRTTPVLDCGVGTAVLGAALAHALPAVRRIAGIDISSGMLARAAANLRAAGVAADLRRADARQLPFPDASFDLVVSAHMLEHLDEPEAALREMLRVLRTGAPVVVVATRGGLADGMIRLKWRHVPLPRWDLVRRFELAGFRYVRTVPIGTPSCPAYWLSRAHLAVKRGDGLAWPRRRSDAEGESDETL